VFRICKLVVLKRLEVMEEIKGIRAFRSPVQNLKGSLKRTVPFRDELSGSRG
jgi:hypothetical protein